MQQAQMDQAHREFVDEMYYRFGFREHPGYCPVEVVPLLVSAGGFTPPNRIAISDLLEEDVDHTVYHESAHFLHPYYRRSWQIGEKSPEEDDPLHELVAHFGTMLHLQEKRGRDEVERYFSGRVKADTAILIARELLDKGESRLFRPLANANLQEAHLILATQTSRELRV